jgi:hypothetical protein
MRGLQVTAAKDAAHGHGINEVLVCRTLAIGADFRRHLRLPLLAARASRRRPREVVVTVAQRAAGQTRIFSASPSDFLLGRCALPGHHFSQHFRMNRVADFLFVRPRAVRQFQAQAGKRIPPASASLGFGMTTIKYWSIASQHVLVML